MARALVTSSAYKSRVRFQNERRTECAVNRFSAPRKPTGTPREHLRFAVLPDPEENGIMVAALRKSPSIKQWTALILFLGIFSWVLTVTVENYREFKSFERNFDLLSSECAQHGGCTLPGYDF